MAKVQKHSILLKNYEKHDIKIHCIFVATYTWYVNGYIQNGWIGW